MKRITDAGLLIGFLGRLDAHHKWAARIFERESPPFYTAEPILAEVAAVLGTADDLLRMVETGDISIQGKSPRRVGSGRHGNSPRAAGPEFNREGAKTRRFVGHRLCWPKMGTDYTDFPVAIAYAKRQISSVALSRGRYVSGHDGRPQPPGSAP